MMTVTMMFVHFISCADILLYMLVSYTVEKVKTVGFLSDFCFFSVLQIYSLLLSNN